jgi:hypothetical protein
MVPNVTLPLMALRMNTTCIGGTFRSTVLATMFWNAKMNVPQNITASPFGKRDKKLDAPDEIPAVVEQDAVAASREGRDLGEPRRPASSSSSSPSLSALDGGTSPASSLSTSCGRESGISISSTSPHVAPAHAISDKHSLSSRGENVSLFGLRLGRGAPQFFWPDLDLEITVIDMGRFGVT